ncbi:unnamed protein product [Bursaphelenchus xylophilus]|uniref:(pine wood nematode) hypothetical protein n=1 Tax=Bursaphelenchus xylophilus TaxID=6326 RepID=A0A7I8WFT7_BURXY|nr:unnamed protein product [Bursaphelenchus xylophilus]CAG9112023.1 unnamed protein product [Bursaphelenchus xylophilus]
MWGLINFVLFSLIYASYASCPDNFRQCPHVDMCAQLSLDSLENLLDETEQFTSEFSQTHEVICKYSNLTGPQLRHRRLFLPSLMCSLVKNTGGIHKVKFAPHRYVAAFAIVLCQGWERQGLPEMPIFGF